MKKIIVILLVLLITSTLGCNENTSVANNEIAAKMEPQIVKVESAVQAAKQESGVTVTDEQIFIPSVVKDIEENLDVVIENSKEDELLSIDFCNDQYLHTDKYEIVLMWVNTFFNSLMYGGKYGDAYTIDEWMTSINPQIFNDGERDYYKTVFDWEGDETAKGFILRYIIEENTVFNVSGKILHFEGDILTEQMARNIYEDFKVIRLSELKS